MVSFIYLTFLFLFYIWGNQYFPLLDNWKQFSVLTQINMGLSEMPPSYHEKVGRREKTLVL